MILQRKILISGVCLIALSVLSIHLYVTINERVSNSIRAIIVAGFILIPFMIATLVAAFKKKWFHPVMWAATFIEIFLFSIIYFEKVDSSSKSLEQINTIENHFKNKANFFTRYTPILTMFDYSDSLNSNNQYKLKIIYRLGRKKRENYYIGKVLLNEKNDILKEYYDQKAIVDTQFFYKEFGKVLPEAAFIGEFIEHSR